VVAKWSTWFRQNGSNSNLSWLFYCSYWYRKNSSKNYYGGFTAEQWKHWVNLYSMFALRDLLPHEHYVCWQTLVLACFTLSKKTISTVELQKNWFTSTKFCKTVEQLYDTEAITPNMHLCCHLADCISDYGSVYNFWLFSFKPYNGVLGNCPTNKRNIAVQLMQKFVNETDCSNRQLHLRKNLKVHLHFYQDHAQKYIKMMVILLQSNP